MYFLVESFWIFKKLKIHATHIAYITYTHVYTRPHLTHTQAAFGERTISAIASFYLYRSLEYEIRITQYSADSARAESAHADNVPNAATVDKVWRWKKIDLTW